MYTTNSYIKCCENISEAFLLIIQLSDISINKIFVKTLKRFFNTSELPFVINMVSNY